MLLLVLLAQWRRSGSKYHLVFRVFTKRGCVSSGLREVRIETGMFVLISFFAQMTSEKGRNVCLEHRVCFHWFRGIVSRHAFIFPEVQAAHFFATQFVPTPFAFLQDASSDRALLLNVCVKNDWRNLLVRSSSPRQRPRCPSECG